MPLERIEEIVRSGDLTLLGDSYAGHAASFLSNPYNDINIRPEIRKEIAVLFAVTHLSGDPRTYKMAKRVLEITGGNFDCLDLLEFCKSSRGKVALEMMSSYKKEEKIVELYFFTMQNRIIHEHNLADLLKFKYGKGVRITPIIDGSCCSACKRGKQTFTWNEIHKLPKVPRHWGCRCGIMAWT